MQNDERGVKVNGKTTGNSIYPKKPIHCPTTQYIWKLEELKLDRYIKIVLNSYISHILSR
jgi:hypothetical protein